MGKSATSNFLVIEVRDNGFMLKHDEYLYVLERKRKDVKYYRCRRKSCKTRGIIKTDTFQQSGDTRHNHEKDIDFSIRAEVRQKLLERARQAPGTPTLKIYNTVIAEEKRRLMLIYDEEQIVAALPGIDFVRSSILRKRNLHGRKNNKDKDVNEPCCQFEGKDPDANSSDSANKEVIECSHSNDCLKQQHEEAALPNPTDDSSAGPSNVKPPYVMKESKVFVNVAFFVKSLQNLNNHGGDGCNFSDMYISGETNNDWNVGIELSCTMCLTTAVVWMEDPGSDLKKQHPPKPPTSAGATAKKTPLTAEKVLSTPEELLKEQEKRKTKKFINKQFISHIISQVPEKKRRVSKRNIPAPPPDPPVQQYFTLPPSLVRPLHVPQSNSFLQEWTGNPSYPINPHSSVSQSRLFHQDWTGSPSHSFDPHIMVPQSASIHQNLMDKPSNLINSHFINQVPFIKQEIGEPENAANSFLNRVPLSPTQLASVQLLFSVDNSNDMPLSVDENATSTPGADFGNHRTSPVIGLKSGQTMATSANQTVLPEVAATEVLPVDLNLVKAEIEEESISMEVNNMPSVRIVPMSETSINRSETAFASESFTETSKDSALVTTKSVMASTKTYATERDAKLSASVSDILGAKDVSVNS